MATEKRLIPLLGASILAVLLVAGAYILSGPNPFLTPRVDAKSAEELLKAYAAKDTDADGLFDWQEELYGTDPANPESFAAGMTDGEAAAQGLLTPKSLVTKLSDEEQSSFPGTAPAKGSLTEQFAQKFFTEYLTTRGNTPPSEAEVLAFVNSAIVELSATSSSPDAYTLRDVHVSGPSAAAGLRIYAVALENVFAKNTIPADKDALAYFEDGVNAGGPTAFAKLADMSIAYHAIAKAMVQLSVPSNVAGTHLRIANALSHMGDTVGDMAAMENDPIRALIGIGTYNVRAKGMVSAFGELSPLFTNANISFVEGEPGFYVYRTANTSASALSATQTTP